MKGRKLNFSLQRAHFPFPSPPELRAMFFNRSVSLLFDHRTNFEFDSHEFLGKLITQDDQVQTCHKNRKKISNSYESRKDDETKRE